MQNFTWGSDHATTGTGASNAIKVPQGTRWCNIQAGVSGAITAALEWSNDGAQWDAALDGAGDPLVLSTAKKGVAVVPSMFYRLNVSGGSISGTLHAI